MGMLSIPVDIDDECPYFRSPFFRISRISAEHQNIETLMLTDIDYGFSIVILASVLGKPWIVCRSGIIIIIMNLCKFEEIVDVCA